MNRCDYCTYRNSWDCADGYYRIPKGTLCENFKLDFDVLPDKKKDAIQKYILNIGKN